MQKNELKKALTEVLKFKPSGIKIIQKDDGLKLEVGGITEVLQISIDSVENQNFAGIIDEKEAKILLNFLRKVKHNEGYFKADDDTITCVFSNVNCTIKYKKRDYQEKDFLSVPRNAMGLGVFCDREKNKKKTAFLNFLNLVNKKHRFPSLQEIAIRIREDKAQFLVTDSYFLSVFQTQCNNGKLEKDLNDLKDRSFRPERVNIFKQDKGFSVSIEGKVIYFHGSNKILGISLELHNHPWGFYDSIKEPNFYFFCNREEMAGVLPVFLDKNNSNRVVIDPCIGLLSQAGKDRKNKISARLDMVSSGVQHMTHVDARHLINICNLFQEKKVYFNQTFSDGNVLAREGDMEYIFLTLYGEDDDV